ncbi:protein roadkill [Trichonephila clavata]|uniref:Protein roadkill n=1 Tax=Trichonephila clavata TaxID=2740835 RepID=A0A8X6L0Q6_TRICU|nr:protein roadkill [Trichonephila clavata]
MEVFKFVWKIDRYNFIPCYRGKVLESPEFHVKTFGSTFLKLYPKGDVLDSFDESLTVNLKYCTKFKHLTISCDVELVWEDVRTKYFIEVVYANTKWKCRVDKRSPIPYIDIENEKVLNNCNFFSPADLIVTICFYENISDSLHMTEELSEDLKKVYENRQFCDLILRSGTEEFHVHKAIIFARIPKLYAHLMQKNKTDSRNEDEKKVLTEATLDMEPSVLRVLLCYVYSGKVDSTASVMPTGLYEVAKSYEMVDLKEKLHTSPSQITARTCVKIDYNVFRWQFSNIYNLKLMQRVYSPAFSGGIVPCSDLKMECYIIRARAEDYPNIPSDLLSGKKKLMIFIHRLFKGDPIYVRFKITVEELPSFKYIAEHVFDTDDVWELPSFFLFNRQKVFLTVDLGDRCTYLKGFTLKCEYSISADESAFVEGTECTAASTENFVAQSNNVTNLSNDLASLYDIFLPKVSDIVFQINNVKFPVHKVVLAARSPVFARMFKHGELETVGGIINISDLDISILNLLLMYLYSGKTELLNYYSAVKLYGATNKYEVISLKKFCAEYLKEILSSGNVCDILILADMHCDTNLKKFAIDFISAHSDVILRLPEWKELIDSRTELASEVLQEITKTILTQRGQSEEPLS